MDIFKKNYDLLAVLLLFSLAAFFEFKENFSLIEDETLSYRQILRTHLGDPTITEPARDIVIVYTDEEFYSEYDMYPLRRTDLAKMIDRLKKMGSSVIGVDMLLDFKSAYGEDPVLEGSLKKAENVVMVSQAEFSGSEYLGLNQPIERFAQVSENGYSNISPASVISESITRLRIHEEVQKKSGAWPFAVKAASMHLKNEPVLEDNQLRIGPDTVVALDQFNELYIEYPLLPVQGNNDVARLHDIIGVSALDILFSDEEELADLAFLFNNKIALIGEVAEVAHDEFETPVGNVYGVEIIANTINTILNSGTLEAAPLYLEITVLMCLAVFFLLSRFLQNPFSRNAINLLIVASYVIACTILYVYSGVILSMSYALIASLFAIIVINAKFYLSEMGEKTMIREMFGQYLSPKVVEELVDDPSRVRLGGEEREMTAYFSDIAGFSSISEKLTPSQLVQALNEYLTEMCNIIVSYDGTVDKYEGDAIISFWGAPIVQKDHARLACHASIEMSKRIIELEDTWASAGIPELKVRMGLNSGPMVVGNMGSAQRMNYTIMGDAVNLAARLEGANKAYGSHMMISERTYQACENQVDVRELDTIRVVGKKEAVTVYELLDKKNETPSPMSDLVVQFSDALIKYKNRDFLAAKELFDKCLNIISADGPSRVYAERCALYLESPPPLDWDGVFTLTEKG